MGLSRRTGILDVSLRILFRAMRVSMPAHAAFGDSVANNANAFDGRVIRGDRELYEREIAIRARESDDRNVKLVRFADGRVFVARVNDEQSSRQFWHACETAETNREFVYLAVYEKAFALRVFLKLSRLALRHEFLHALHALSDVLEIGERTAYPAADHVGHAGRKSRGLHDIPGFLFPAYEKCLFPASGERGEERGSGLNALPGLFEVKNIRVVFGAEEIGRGARVAARARVAKMRSGLVQGLNVNCGFCHDVESLLGG